MARRKGVLPVASREFAPSEVYLNQSDYHCKFSSRTGFVDRGFVLMQDNDRNHASKLCQKYIKSQEEQHVLQLISWPAQSADLNPIEQMRDKLDQKSDLNNPYMK